MARLPSEVHLPHHTRERQFSAISGWGALFILIAAEAAISFFAINAAMHERPLVFFVGVVSWVLGFLALSGFFVVNPNEARVVMFAGKYLGTTKTNGFFWTIPLFQRRRVTLRAISFESPRLKVNDLDGNPIEVAAIIVWRVVDTASAVFHVDDYVQYVRMQSEAALRDLTSHYPYDAHEPNQHSLRGHTQEVATRLKAELTERCALAGVGIVDARISHLAYSPEIAQAMLQRQQAGAIIAARQRIVDGAVGMVELALERLAKNRVVELDEGRKASMVANLLVVLCSERPSQPIINASAQPF